MRSLKTTQEQQEIDALWQQLEATCAAAMRLSQDVETQLQQGADGHELVPLLRREAQLADQLYQGIHQLDQRPDSTIGARGKNLVRQMKDLLTMEQENYCLLSRKGVRLNGPRFKRY
jgi:hypothetical protein